MNLHCFCNAPIQVEAYFIVKISLHIFLIRVHISVISSREVKPGCSSPTASQACLQLTHIPTLFLKTGFRCNCTHSVPFISFKNSILNFVIPEELCMCGKHAKTCLGTMKGKTLNRPRISGYIQFGTAEINRVTWELFLSDASPMKDEILCQLTVIVLNAG